jgi:alkylation response protein AidB-like acyl-CoA dehydrogenase
MARAGQPFERAEGSMSKLERWHRDAKIFTIFEGTSEIQRMLIGRTITGLDVR